MPQPDRSLEPAFCALLLDNHHRLVGSRLEPDGMSPTETASWLYHDAPFGVLAHGSAADPVFGVARDGYVTGYRGLRVAKSGRQFRIGDVTVWSLLDERGGQVGQAAAYRRSTPAFALAQ